MDHRRHNDEDHNDPAVRAGQARERQNNRAQGETDEEILRLIRDLLPSPRAANRDEPDMRPLHEGSATMAMTTVSKRRVVTVNDLKNRTCWICQDGDEEALPAEQRDGQHRGSVPAPTPATKRQQRKKFVHPCECTLVAHESCLLTWIYRKATPQQPIVSCPQCGHAYKLHRPAPLPLRLFQAWDNLVSTWRPLAYITGGTSFFLAVNAAYGLAVVRLWFGGAAARRLFVQQSFLGNLMDVMPIAPFLIASRLPYRDVFYRGSMSALPAVATVWPVILLWLHSLNSPATATTRFIRVGSSAVLAGPPGPAITLLCLPWARMLYLRLKSYVTRRVLKPFIKKPPAAIAAAASAGSRPQPAPTAGRDQRRVARHTRVVIVGDRENHLVDADAAFDGPIPAGVEAVVEGPGPVPGGGEAAVVDAGNEDDDGEDRDAHRRILNEADLEADIQAVERTIYVSPSSLLRLFTGALSFPWRVGGVGELLNSIAFAMKPNNWLERFLCLGPFRGRGVLDALSDLTLGSTDYALSRRTFQPRVDMPLKQHGLWVESNDKDSPFLWSHSRNTGPTLHWRNTVSMGLYIVASDCAALAYRYLRLKQRANTQVVDRPFASNLIAGLDLK